jgi:hypothetical protein
VVIRTGCPQEEGSKILSRVSVLFFSGSFFSLSSKQREMHHARSKKKNLLAADLKERRKGSKQVTSCTSSLVILPSTLVSTLNWGTRTAQGEAHQESMEEGARDLTLLGIR